MSRFALVALGFFLLPALGTAQVSQRQATRQVQQATGASGAAAQRIARISMEVMGPILNSPEFRNALMNHPRIRAASSQAEANAIAQQIGAQLSSRGIARLPDASIRDWHRLRRQMTSHQALCAGMWTGAMPQGALGAGLASLNDTDLRRWMQISAEAMMLEVRSTTRVRRADAGALVRQVRNSLAGREQTRFDAALGSSNVADQCYLTQTVDRFAASLRGAAQVTFLRQLASLMTPSV
ncbi:MAG: hypothetical protein AAGE52_39075 [Myxococcota bacterium]